ncbi:MAG: sigma-54 dependent transcriptional regulator [Fibrobacterota bacterium]
MGIFVSMDEQGNVGEILYQENRYNFNFDLLINRNLAEFYHIPESPPLPERFIRISDKREFQGFFDLTRAFRSKNIYEGFDLAFDFFSELPFTHLILLQIENFGRFGVLIYNSFFIRASVFKHQPIVMLDAEGRVQGFNKSFFTLLNAGTKIPFDFLGKSAEAVLAPNPIRTFRSDDAYYLPHYRSPWMEFHSEQRPHRTGMPAGPWQEKDIFLIAGTDSSERITCKLLPLHVPFNFKQADFRLKVQLEIRSGELPKLILCGESEIQQFFPDLNGYLFGHEASSGHYFIKRHGELIHRRKTGDAFGPGVYTVEIFRRGTCLALFINNDFKIGFTEFEINENENGNQYLFYGAGDDFTLQKMILYSQQKERDPASLANECRIQNNTDNLFRFHSLVEQGFSKVGSHFYYAFMFYDVTRFKQSIQTLEAQKEKSDHELDKYKSIIARLSLEQKNMVGTSPDMIRLTEKARIAAQSPVSILIEGDTGTGKEIFAYFIHKNSPYNTGPFIKVDCSLLPGTLLESELFGFEKGAFTGAIKQRLGKFEEADGGTLFLDEVGNLSMEVQIKLLQFLQDLTIERIGGNKRIKVNTRIITATNASLRNLVEEKKFRSDLYYRLNTVYLKLPPLSARREDIPHLAIYFLKEYNYTFNRSIEAISPEAFQKLLAYDWPGNIRELENVMQRAVLFCIDKQIEIKHIDLPAAPSPSSPLRSGEPSLSAIPFGISRAFRKEHILSLLKKNNNIVDWAAREARMSRATFYRKMREFRINRK